METALWKRQTPGPEHLFLGGAPAIGINRDVPEAAGRFEQLGPCPVEFALAPASCLKGFRWIIEPQDTKIVGCYRIACDGAGVDL
ncbi:hypothetical protein MCRY_09280 [Marivita cryptomonadis]|nr:hypothetical protein MCRY_09280 [Marivita cryptomonadis]